MVKVTDYKRVAAVPVTQLEQLECPKCRDVCNETSPDRRSPPQKRREWNCTRCGRGWIEVPAWVSSVTEAHQVAEKELAIESDSRFIATGDHRLQGGA